MRHKLTPNTLSTLNNRFYEFADSKIYKVQLDLMASPNQMSVLVEAPDWINGPSTMQNRYLPNMVKITFELEWLTKYIIRQPENSGLVLLHYLNIAFFDDEIYMDFNPSHSDPSYKEGYTTESKPHRTQFFVAAKSCFWSVEEK